MRASLSRPDRSGSWPRERGGPGRTMTSSANQPVRDWLDADMTWDKTAPAPPLPAEVVADTRSRYIAAYEMLTGEPFSQYRERAGA